MTTAHQVADSVCTVADLAFGPQLHRISGVHPTDATFGAPQLRDLAVRVGGSFSASANDGRPVVVAVLLPQGPQLAAALLAVMSCATALPINPKLSATEIEFTLVDANATIMLTQAGFHPVAETVGTRLGLRMLDLQSLDGQPRGEWVPNANDTALMLHTSGTTARPKLVPLTHRNLCASATAVAAAMQLGHDDCGLAVMPLFHIHGIVGSLLSSLAAGAHVRVAKFDAFAVQRQLHDFDCTWMSAVPTMYQAMLLRPPGDQLARLRAVRSSSSPLPTEVWRRLQDRLGCTVVNSYGMTEAAHQMASTGIPGDADLCGSVGLAAGPEIAVLSESGSISATGHGELVIRGASVTAGYLSPSGANDQSRIDGWFRTGDTGSISDRHVIHLLGRLKELINVGGEKVSPFEVDDALLSHPMVSEAVTFAMPSVLLGEEVQAVVTLTGDVDEAQLRRHARLRLAKFKTPVRIHIVDAIPTGPTGKVQRLHLPKQLGL